MSKRGQFKFDSIGNINQCNCLKGKHLQLLLRILRQWFTRKTLLNTQYLNVMGRTILLECQRLAKFVCQLKIYLYTPVRMFGNKISPCCLRPN